MSVFTDKEIEYLAGQRLGRIATTGPDGQPHVVPTSFRYNAEHDAIDVGGLRMSQTKKLRDVQRTGRASIVIDDVLPPWQPRMIEVRGSASVIPSGGKAPAWCPAPAVQHPTACCACWPATAKRWPSRTATELAALA
jgi:pyridoxamine 5'-phosphate oxidase family protein